MASCSRNSNSPVSSEDYSAELRLMGDFNNTSLMKCNNAGYGVLLMMETGLFCHPSPDWYSSGGVVKRMIRRKVFPMSEDKILEGFHFANDYDPYTQQ